jgi:hypothetical protein
MSLSATTLQVTSLGVEGLMVIAPDKTTLVYQSLTQDPKTKRITAVYVIGASDNNHPATVTYSVDPPADTGSRYCAVSFRTWVAVTESVTDLVTYYPVQANVSFTIPNGMPLFSAANLRDLLQCTFSYTYDSAISGVAQTPWLQKLLFSSPAVV